MFAMRYAVEADQGFWLLQDEHIKKDELLLKIRDKRGYIITSGDTPIGILRYNLFLDMIPFLTMIHLGEAYRSKGFGSRALFFWENEMQGLGYPMVMTSTQVDEGAQHFYRKLGYKDRGSLFLDHTPLEQPQELLMLKVFK